MDTGKKTVRRLTAGVGVIVLLCVCLSITSFALVYSMVSVENNLFSTGKVRIDLNGGEPVIRDHEFLFEPGMTVKKDFYVRNESTCDIYYRLYFRQVEGGLADVLEVTVCNGEQVLYTGTPGELSRFAVAAADDVLGIGEVRQLQIYFHFPEAGGNDAQNQFLRFSFAADAVQVKNNTNKDFR